MAHIRKKAPPETGEGVLSYGGHKERVGYEVDGSIAALRPGGPSLRTAIATTSDIARDAFRAGEVNLLAADGKTYRLRIIAHSEGSATAYGDLRI